MTDNSYHDVVDTIIATMEKRLRLEEKLNNLPKFLQFENGNGHDVGGSTHNQSSVGKEYAYEQWLV